VKSPFPSQPNQHRILLAAFIALGILCAACGGSATDHTAPDAISFEQSDEDTASEIVEPAMTEFHVRWLCELQRRTFPDLATRDAALDETLSDAAIERADYDAFVASLDESEAARMHVRELYVERCDG